MDAVNTFRGRPDILIGLVGDGKVPGDLRYIRALSERDEDGR